MKKTLGLFLGFTILLSLSGCDLFTSELQKATKAFASDYNNYNQMNIEISLSYDQVDLLMNIEIIEDGDISEMTMDTNVDYGSQILHETQTGYYQVIDDALYFYYPHPLDDSLYYIIEETYEEPLGYDTEYSFLSDLSSFEEVEDDIYQAEFSLADIIGSMDNYLDELISVLGGEGIELETPDETVVITVILDNEEIDYIEIDISSVCSVLLSEIFTTLLGQKTTIDVTSTMTLRFSINENVALTIPSKVVEAGLMDDSPRVTLATPSSGSLDFLYDQDNYRLVIFEAGFYHFDVASDQGLVVTVTDPLNPSIFIYENIFFSSIELNSRVLFLEEGEYMVSVTNANPAQPIKPYAFTVSKIYIISDDYDWDMLIYDDEKEADITDYRSVAIRYDYSGDIDTIYFPWFEMQNAILKVPKTVQLFSMSNMDIHGYIQTETFNYYVVRFHNPDSYQRYTWSLSFIHITDELYKTIVVDDAYSRSEDDPKSLGTLSTTNELVIYAFQSDYIVLNVPTSGNYRLQVEQSREDATFSANIFTDIHQGNYIGTMSDYNDLTFQLDAGRYYLFPNSNWSDLALFKLSIQQLD